MLLVAADVYLSGFDSRCAVEIQFSHRYSVSCAGSERGRTRSQMEVILGWINETWIREMRVTVIPRGLNMSVKTRHGGRGPRPCARLRPGDAVIKVMIDRCGQLVFVDFKSVHRDKAAWPRVHDVVFENVVRHVTSHLELTRTGCRRIILVKSVVDHRAVIGVSSLGRITSDRNARSMA